mgnify:CR=1 FL=1
MENIMSQVQFSPILVLGKVKQGRISKFNFDHALHKFILIQKPRSAVAVKTNRKRNSVIRFVLHVPPKYIQLSYSDHLSMLN